MSATAQATSERRHARSGLPIVPWISVLAVLTLIGLLWVYWLQTRLPTVVRIAGGPEGGRYSEIAEGLAAELRSRLKVDVIVSDTEGSLANLQELQSGNIHFGLYQAETSSVLEQAEAATVDSPPAAFVSNLYPEFLIPIGPANHPTDTLVNSGDQTWSCSDRMSGDYAVSRWLLDHIGRSEDQVGLKSVKYVDLVEQLQNESIDIGILCCGINAPILREVLQPGTAELKAIPSVDAFTRKHPSLTREVIPAGFFQAMPQIPANDFPTVVLQAQLLAGNTTPVKLVEEATRIVSDPAFQRRHGLTELFKKGNSYATDRSEFPMHVGASHIFFPELKPLINPDFVEGTEGLRSFVVSILVAAWLLHRWWSRRQIRSQEHRLDRYIRKLLELELEQLEVDGEGGPGEAKALQEMLDKVTYLRQEALSEFSAHELNEDRAADSFVQMCHALSDKINGKLIRQAIYMTSFPPQTPKLD